MNYFEYLNKLLTTSAMSGKVVKIDVSNPILQTKIDTKGSLFVADDKKFVNLSGKPIFEAAGKDNLKNIDYEALTKKLDLGEKASATSKTTETTATTSSTETTATTGTTGTTETAATTAETENLSTLEYVLKEFLSIDKVKELADTTKDGKLSTEEIKNYVLELAKKDGNGENLTLDDFDAVIKELGIDLEKLLKEAEASEATRPEATTPAATETAATEDAAAQQAAATQPVDTACQQPPVQEATVAEPVADNTSYADSGSYVQDAAPASGGYSAPAESYDSGAAGAQVQQTTQNNNNIDNMSLEELKTECSTRKTKVADAQKSVEKVLNGKNENVKAAEDSAKEAKEAYEKALKEDPAAEPFRKDIEKNLKEIEKTEHKLDENANEINKKEGEISELESSLSGAQADLKALEAKLSALPVNGDDENITKQRGEVIEQLRKKKEEVAKLEKDLGKLKQELEKLNKEKTDLETQKTELEKTKAQLEQKLKEVCSEDTKAKLEAYNQAKAKAENVKKQELDTAKSEQKKAQDALIEVDKKIAEKRNKTNNGNSDRIQKAIEVAEQEYAKGVREVGGEDNGPDVLKYTNGAKVPWCAAFTSYCYGKGQGNDNKDTFGYNQSSQTIKQQAKNSGHWADKNSGYKPKEGDLAIWTYGGWRGHIGLVTDVNEQTGAFTVIAGNESDRVKKTTYSSPQAVGAKFAGFAKMSDWVA